MHLFSHKVNKDCLQNPVSLDASHLQQHEMNDSKSFTHRNHSFSFFLRLSCQLSCLSFPPLCSSTRLLFFLPHANKVQLNQVSTTAFLTTPTKALGLDGPAIAHAGLAVAPEGCVTLPALFLGWEVCCKALSQAVPFSNLDIV